MGPSVAGEIVGHAVFRHFCSKVHVGRKCSKSRRETRGNTETKGRKQVFDCRLCSQVCSTVEMQEDKQGE